MRRDVRVSLLFGLAMAAFAVPARAEPFPIVETRLAPACEPLAPELERRLAQAFDGKPTTALAASVSIETTESGYLVTIATRDGARVGGTTRIAAPSCDEAVDAAVEVLALAFGERVEEETSPAPTGTGPSESEASSASGQPRESASRAVFESRVPSPKRVDRGVLGASDGSNATAASTRVSLAAGADVGTLPDPALTVTARFARALSALELGGAVRYAPPTTNETVESGFTESVRRDFGAMELRACVGTREHFRLSACAGAELGAVRVVRRLRTEDGADQDEDSVTPRLSGTLAGLFALRGGAVEPELELGGAAVAFGKEAGASWLAIRVAAGAAVAF